MAVAEVVGGRSASGASGWAAASNVTAGSLHPVVWMYLIAIAFPIGFNVGSLSLSAMRVLLLIMIIPLLSGLFSGKYGKLLPTDYLFLAHIFWATVAVGWNNPYRVVENIGSAAIEFLGGYLVGRAYIRTPADFAALCRVLFVLVLCWVPLTLYESQTGNPIILDLINSVPPFKTYFNVQSEIRLGLERSQVVFAHPIHFGLFCSVVFSLCFVGFKGVFPDAKRYVIAFFVGLCTFLALSSGALLALILQLGLIAWSFIFRKSNRKWRLLLAFFAFLYVVVDLGSNRTPLKVLMSYATFSAHTAYWRSIIFDWGIYNVWLHPFVGLGLGDWIRPYYMYSGSMDNFWLVMAVRYGIPGLLTIAIGYADAIRIIGRRDFSTDPVVSQFRLAWMFTFLGLSFTLSTVHIWTSIYSFVLFMLGAGLWLATYEPQSGATDTAPTPPARGSSYTRQSDRPLRRGAQVAATAATTVTAVEAAVATVETPPADGPRYSRFVRDADD